MSAARFRSVIEFQVRPGEEGAFVEAFHACGMLSRPRSIPGFVRAELLRDGSDFAVIGEWTTRESYAAWQEVSQRGAPPEAFATMVGCLSGFKQGRLFEVQPRSLE